MAVENKIGYSTKNITYAITDNLGNIIKDSGNMGNIDGEEKEINLKFNLMKGDLNYDNSVTSEDA